MRNGHIHTPDETGSALAPTDIVGSSPRLLAAIDLARRAAPLNIPVLILGETGTGKELVARLLHEASQRPGHLVPIDCGALPEDLIEALLFGHKRGAFTGAVDHSVGLIAEADRGTLFLDELSSLSERGQAKLLRVLETGVVRRVGESRSAAVGFRLISTAQENIGELVQQSRFRSDLMQRVAGIVLRLPPLRERGSDVADLARHFAGSVGLGLDENAAMLLSRRDWPGNIRELRWTVARAALFAESGIIDVRAIEIALEIGPTHLEAHPSGAPNGAVQLRAVCRAHGGDPDRVAHALGIGRSTLYRRLRHAGIRLETFKATSA